MELGAALHYLHEANRCTLSMGIGNGPLNFVISHRSHEHRQTLLTTFSSTGSPTQPLRDCPSSKDFHGLDRISPAVAVMIYAKLFGFFPIFLIIFIVDSEGIKIFFTTEYSNKNYLSSRMLFIFLYLGASFLSAVCLAQSITPAPTGTSPLQSRAVVQDNI